MLYVLSSSKNLAVPLRSVDYLIVDSLHEFCLQYSNGLDSDCQYMLSVISFPNRYKKVRGEQPHVRRIPSIH